MPELPEVETALRGVSPYVIGKRVREVIVRDQRLRWPIPDTIHELEGCRIETGTRRAKYLLFGTAKGTLLLHLGMSGNLRVLPAETPFKKHDHLAITMEGGKQLRLHDPRRFGAALWIEGDPMEHPLLKDLGPEPLGDDFTADHLQAACKGKTAAIKQVIMDAHIVVGVGNIYASEALFRARIRPRRQARGLKRDEIERLVTAIREVLAMAVEVGGTTLRDYVGVDGNPGYFRQKLFVYERPGEPCRVCAAPVRHFVQGQRSTYWCANCQH